MVGRAGLMIAALGPLSLLRGEFFEHWVDPDEPILLNEKCLRKGGIFRLNGGPCWIDDYTLGGVITRVAGFVAALLVQNAPLVAFCRTAGSNQISTAHQIQKSLHKGGFFVFGGPCWIRTSDQLVKSQPANFQAIDFI